MPRARFVRLCCVLLAAWLGVVACDAKPTPPNVVLITVDTLRADYLGSYGFPLDTSPRIDALAAGGVLFERAVAAASTTSPSHASILTSRHTREHSVGFYSGFTVLDGLPTLPELFKDAGYTTAAFVGNINLQKRLGFDRGFDHYDDDLPDAERNRPLQYERIAERTLERLQAWLDDKYGHTLRVSQERTFTHSHGRRASKQTMGTFAETRLPAMSSLLSLCVALNRVSAFFCCRSS